MDFDSLPQGLSLANELIAEGRSTFTFEEAEQRLGKSKTATANLLSRMAKAGLIDRVRHGRYVVRPLGILGTPAAAEDVAVAVGAAFCDQPHRIAYRSALYEHDLVVHPMRSIQVATTRRVKTKTLSGRPLRTNIEPLRKLEVGRVPIRTSYVSDPHRAVLEAAHRPALVGGIEIVAEAVSTAASSLDPETLTKYARKLGWAAALRRLGSLADALQLAPLADALQPLKPPSADLDLEPGAEDAQMWRDKRWRVRWSRSVGELLSIVGQ